MEVGRTGPGLARPGDMLPFLYRQYIFAGINILIIPLAFDLPFLEISSDIPIECLQMPEDIDSPRFPLDIQALTISPIGYIYAPDVTVFGSINDCSLFAAGAQVQTGMEMAVY